MGEQREQSEKQLPDTGVTRYALVVSTTCWEGPPTPAISLPVWAKDDARVWEIHLEGEDLVRACRQHLAAACESAFRVFRWFVVAVVALTLGLTVLWLLAYLLPGQEGAEAGSSQPSMIVRVSFVLLCLLATSLIGVIVCLLKCVCLRRGMRQFDQCTALSDEQLNAVFKAEAKEILRKLEAGERPASGVSFPLPRFGDETNIPQEDLKSLDDRPRRVNQCRVVFAVGATADEVLSRLPAKLRERVLHR